MKRRFRSKWAIAALTAGTAAFAAGCSSDADSGGTSTPQATGSAAPTAPDEQGIGSVGGEQTPGMGQPGASATPGGVGMPQTPGGVQTPGGAGTTPGAGTNGGEGAPPVSTGPVNAEPTIAPDEVVNADGTMADCATLQRPPSPLRRLTRFEYNNTVRDLFGTALRPADAFPPDEVADGFSNNALVLTVSSLHAEKYVEAAEAVAAEAVSNLSGLLPCDPAMAGEDACAAQFIETYGRQAYRRPLEAEDTAALTEAYAAGGSFEKGIELVIRTLLQSPHFLYRVEFTGTETRGVGMVRVNGFETAARLSYLLWSTTPDVELLDAAQNGQLDAPEQVAERTRVMLQDPRARSAVSEFVRQWLGLTRLEGVTRSPEAFPLWSEDMRAAMLAESQAFVEHVVWDGDASLNSLLTEPAGLAQGPLASLYGVADSASVVSLPPEQQRAGVLTMPGFLTVTAHPDQTSPVLRGKFVRAKLMCAPPPPPPPDANITPPDPNAGPTARDRFSAHADDTECAGCHQLMDPLGFSFEYYDAVGSYRTTEGGVDIDVSGEMLASTDMDGPFVGVAELAQKLAGSNQVRNCIAAQWYKYSVGRSEEGGDACSLRPLQEAFAASDGNLVEMIVAMTQTEAFLYRKALPAEVTQ